MSASIDLLCRSVMQENGNDLYLREDQIPRIRIGGEVVPLGDEPVTKAEMANFWKLCGAEDESILDRDTSYEAADGTRYRVNLHRQLGRRAAALRPILSEIPEMTDLGLSEELLTPWLSRAAGVVLITGATGSGKSTTLAAGVQWINENMARHIVTIEDPIEYLFGDEYSIITQREVGTDTASFAQGLRSSLRQSPDVIFLGEIRDAETARIALRASETGHLVLSTMHSANVSDTLERFLGLFPRDEREPILFILSQQLIGVVSQKLLPGEQRDLEVILEHFQNEAATRNWIRAGDFGKLADFVARGDNPHNQAFMDSLVEAAKSGRVSEETAERSCDNAQEFRRALRGISGGSVSAL
jgi:pilus retraction protein PilT